jgi:hypothetical protein
MRTILRLILIAIPLSCWSDDAARQGGQAEPSTLDLSYGVGIPFLFHARLTVDPFAAPGPVHFETLSTMPYFAHETAVEYGVRIGLVWPLTDSVQFIAEFPYIANPYPQLTTVPSALPEHDFAGHLEAAFGVKFEF